MIHIVNGPNLNLLGRREPDIYGYVSFQDYIKTIREEFPEIDIYYYQSNHEGDLIDYLQQYGMRSDVRFILNPGGYTHTSVALADTVAAISAPVVEVHISDTESREDFRKISYIRSHCLTTIQGRGLSGYEDAIKVLVDSI